MKQELVIEIKDVKNKCTYVLFDQITHKLPYKMKSYKYHENFDTIKTKQQKINRLRKYKIPQLVFTAKTRLKTKLVGINNLLITPRLLFF